MTGLMDIFLRSEEGKKEYFPKEKSIHLEREILYRTYLPQTALLFASFSPTAQTYQPHEVVTGDRGKSKGAEQDDLNTVREKEKLHESGTTVTLRVKRDPNPANIMQI